MQSNSERTKVIKAYAEYARHICLLLQDWLILLLPRGRSAGNRERVLVVKLDAIGDFVVWLDAAKALRRLYPQERYELTLAGNCLWTSLAEKMDYFDAVWPIDRRRFYKEPIYRFKFMWKVRRAGFSVAIYPTFSREYLYGDSVLRCSGARERIGSQGDLSNISNRQKFLSNRWFTRLVPAADAPLMELERNAEFIRGLGLQDFRPNIPDLPDCGPPPPALKWNMYYVLFPGAGARTRQWPEARFAELARRIHRVTGWVGLICGGPGEEALGRAIEADLDVPVQNWIGKTTLPELVSIIAGSQLLVANETSAIHIAAAVSTPSICILGGGHHGRFIPYRIQSPTDRPLPVAISSPMECFGCDWDCIDDEAAEKGAPCVKSISVDAAWDAVRTVIIKQASSGTDPK